MTIQYMTTNGVWVCSCQGPEDKPDPALVEAPADADGFRGTDGMQWNGTGWVEYSPPPASCTALQGRLALGETRCSQIAAMLPSLPWASRQAWEYATTWHRTSPLIQSFAQAFSLSSNDVDNLFRLAVTLEV